MNYIEYRFKIEPDIPGNDVLMSLLGDGDFESFVEEQNTLLAYVKEEANNIHFVAETINSLKEFYTITFTYKLIMQQNWNSTWESQFEAVIINSDCIIRAPFHKRQVNFKFELIIMPKMSFGTGHHQTTFLMCNTLLALNLNNIIVLDMGCGTGVLAILAAKKNALQVHAVDIDTWSVENTLENIETNNASNIKVWQGDAKTIVDNYNVILANINKNILMQDALIYYHHLVLGGNILLSGFFVTDIEELIACYTQIGFTHISSVNKEEWAQITFKK